MGVVLEQTTLKPHAPSNCKDYEHTIQALRCILMYYLGINVETTFHWWKVEMLLSIYIIAGLPHRSSIEVAAAKPRPIRGRAEPAVSFSATVYRNEPDEVGTHDLALLKFRNLLPCVPCRSFVFCFSTTSCALYYHSFKGCMFQLLGVMKHRFTIPSTKPVMPLHSYM